VIVNEFFLSGVLRFLDLSRRQFQHLSEFIQSWW